MFGQLQVAVGEVGKQSFYGFLGAIPIGADHSGRAAFVPADGVQAGDRGAVDIVGDASVHVRGPRGCRVHWDSRYRVGVVSDRVNHHCGSDHLGGGGGLGYLHRQRGSSVVDRRHGGVEPKYDSLVAPTPSVGVCPQKAQLATQRAIVGGALAQVVESGVRVYFDVESGNCRECCQFRLTECRVSGASTAKYLDFLDAASSECFQRVRSDVGFGETGRICEQDTCDVEGNIAVPDHDCTCARQVELVVHRIGVAVVPPGELVCGHACRKVRSRDVECASYRCAGGDDDGMVVLA